MTSVAAEIWTFAGALVAPLIVGFFTLENRKKTSENTLQLQLLKGVVAGELEKLKAKLSHSQVISSTQWQAEFGSYQAIWKCMVPVRMLAAKIVFREDELSEMGFPLEYVASTERVEIRKNLISKFVEASSALLLAIHENAPFYPAPIRKAANQTHISVKKLIEKQMIAFTDTVTRGVDGADVSKNQQVIAESRPLLIAVMEGVDLVEALIRDRLADVEVMDRVKP